VKRVLAIDTSTWRGALALVEQSTHGDEPDVVAELGIRVDDSHAVHLTRWLDSLLGLAGWSKSDLDAYIAIRGPGSFTGIRVGLGTVRGLAVATGKPCFGVNRLEAMAEAHGAADAERIALLSAGRGEYYGARYDAESSPPRELRAPWLGAAGERLGAEPDGAVLIVPAELERETSLRQLAAGRFKIARARSIIAGAAGRLTLLDHASGTAKIYPPTPLYLRPPDAELKFQRR
jgi:tRNA threonylcarbamoyladenosine biosynthesis protein TsaB